MRVNLNNYILNGNTYLTYLFENNHIPHSFYNYEKFIQNDYDKYDPALLDLCDKNNINITPYLYTLHCIDERTYKAFSVFFKTYMNRTGLLDKSEDDILIMASSSIDILVSLIITMQYYFL